MMQPDTLPVALASFETAAITNDRSVNAYLGSLFLAIERFWQRIRK